jgi:hypothetical protein
MAPPQSFTFRTFRAMSLAEAKLSVEQLADKINLKGENVLVRVDLNVPLAKVSLLVAIALTRRFLLLCRTRTKQDSHCRPPRPHWHFLTSVLLLPVGPNRTISR